MSETLSSKSTTSLWRRKGGIFFYCGAVTGRKNIFVNAEYLELLVNAFKMTELKLDVKNLAYVIMPNFFYWLFRLNPEKDNPVEVYKFLKKDLTREILRTLVSEVKEGKKYELAPIFRGNERVGRSPTGKILDVFSAGAKQLNNGKRFQVWIPHTELKLIDTAALLEQKIRAIKAIPVSERWQLVQQATDYPYLYLAEDLPLLVSAAVPAADLPASTMPESLATINA